MSAASHNLVDPYSVELLNLDDESRDLLRRLDNLAINPSFETTLSGPHTRAITVIGFSGAILNSCVLGWQGRQGDTNGAVVELSADPSVYSATGSRGSLRIWRDPGAVFTGTCRVRQVWGGTVSGVDQYLEHYVAAASGRRLSIALDVKQGAAKGDAIRPFIFTNGTGGTTAFGDCHASDTDWERLTVAADIPTDATEIHFGVEFDTSAGMPSLYWLDNCMAAVSTATLSPSALEYEPRLPATLQTAYLGVTSNTVQYDNPPDTNYRRTGLGLTGFTVDCDFNATRPAWANSCKALVYGQGGAAGSYGNIRPSGHASAGQLIGCVTYNTLDCQLHLGVDGQLEFSVGHINNDLVVQLRQWRGDGL